MIFASSVHPRTVELKEKRASEVECNKLFLLARFLCAKMSLCAVTNVNSKTILSSSDFLCTTKFHRQI